MDCKNNGITLIALVVTIIILLILVGITISELTGSGLFNKANKTKEKSENAQELENQTLGKYEDLINEYIDGSNRDTNNSGYKVSLLWEGEAASGDITFLNNHKFNEFDSIKFIYSSEGNAGPVQEQEFMLETIQFSMNNSSKYVGLYGYDNCYIELNNFVDNGFSIMGQRSYVLNKVYGINY